MNNERRFDRMERLLRLLIRAGKRGRTRLNDLDEKIGMLVDAQIRTEDQLHLMNEQSIAMRDEHDKRSREVFELFRLTDEKIATLTEAQIVSDSKLSALIERT
ncbi:MAG: hypothetical protein DMF69_22920 [Acidobacteria bacterium]|nr:MAG: hypothetical protein DMF69_22920 [Acidobacteriota bacterium]